MQIRSTNFISEIIFNMLINYENKKKEKIYVLRRSKYTQIFIQIKIELNADSLNGYF